MGLTTTKKISLDFHNNNFISVNAKQYDTNSRYINITCTEDGKEKPIDNHSMIAYVKCIKPDGNFVLNYAEILNDGTILVELTPQMLAAVGKCQLDIMITSVDGLNIENLSSIDTFDDLNSNVISTMCFYLNVLPSSIDGTGIESSSEYNGLLNTLQRYANLKESLTDHTHNRLSHATTGVDVEWVVDGTNNLNGHKQFLVPGKEGDINTYSLGGENKSWDYAYVSTFVKPTDANSIHFDGEVTMGTKLDPSEGGTGRDLTSVPANAILRAPSDWNEFDFVGYTETKSGALYAEEANGIPKFGVLPIAQGGTGATTADGAVTKLGAAHKEHTHSRLTSIYTDDYVSLASVKQSDETYKYFFRPGQYSTGYTGNLGDYTIRDTTYYLGGESFGWDRAYISSFYKPVGADSIHFNSKVTMSTKLAISEGGTGYDLSSIPEYAIIRNSSKSYDYLYYTPTANGAFYATGDNKEATFGTLPVAQGGTGYTERFTGLTLNSDYDSNTKIDTEDSKNTSVFKKTEYGRDYSATIRYYHYLDMCFIRFYCTSAKTMTAGTTDDGDPNSYVIATVGKIGGADGKEIKYYPLSRSGLVFNCGKQGYAYIRGNTDNDGEGKIIIVPREDIPAGWGIYITGWWIAT